MIILHNPHSKESRDFIALYGAGETVIDWYADGDAVPRYLDKYPSPGGFPSILDEDTEVIVAQPSSPIDLVLAVIEHVAGMKQDELETSCEAAITSGLYHNTLGALHEYGTAPTDQVNMSASVTAAKIYGEAAGPYLLWCADENGVWARREHTPAQIEVVGLAIMALVRDSQNQFEAKLIELASSTTLEEMEAVTWESEQ